MDRSHFRRELLLSFVVALTVSACSDTPPTEPNHGAPALPTTPSAVGPVTLVGAGDIADCLLPFDDLTANLLDGISGTVFTLGDNVYPSGTSQNFSDCYAPTWGRHRARTRPAAGNHDYNTSGAEGYFGYFGALAGDPSKGYYSYAAGDWKVIVLNSNIARGASSPQVQWLAEELRSAGQQCVAAMWHHPMFTSTLGRTTNASVRPLWDTLYAYGADLIVNAHDHVYERFTPMKPDGTRDATFGIRQFTVGTGGASLYTLGIKPANSEARSALVHGVIKLTLEEGRYSWQFVPVLGGVLFTDTGTTSCHGRPGGDPPPPNQPPIANPGGPYTSTGTVTFDGSASSDPDGNLPLTYAWDFGDGASGTGVSPAHTYGAPGGYTASLVVTDSRGASSTRVSTSVTISQPPPQVAVIAGAGNISKCSSTALPRAEATAKLLDSIPGTVMPLGDNVETGTADELANCYGTTWGRHLARTRAVLGNHEYVTAGATPSFDYFGDKVGPRDLGYYSFDTGAWHVVVLNDNIAFASGSAQDQWLVSDLASTTKACVIAVWHTALNQSSNTAGSTRTSSRKIIWDRLQAAGAELALNAQAHHYERMAPMLPDGTIDPANGIRQFNVGVGGESVVMPTVAIHPASEVRAIDYGVLKLTLRPGGYDWEFKAIPGSSFTDSGSGTCH